MQNERACANSPAISTAMQTFLSAMLDPFGDVPFVSPVILPDGNEMFATCYPCCRIVHAYPYLLRDGRVILGERLGELRVNFGHGWKLSIGEPDVIGRVALLHLRNKDGSWSTIARPGCYLS